MMGAVLEVLTHSCDRSSDDPARASALERVEAAMEQVMISAI